MRSRSLNGRVFGLLLGCLLLPGCVVSTVIGVAAETVEAGIEITGAVVGAAVDIVTDDDEEDE